MRSRVLSICRLAFLASLVLTAPAAAGPCLDQVQALELRLQSPGAAAAEGGAPHPPTPAGTPAPRTVSPAAETDARFAAARTALSQARTLDARGDDKGCNDALSEVKRSLGPLP